MLLSAANVAKSFGVDIILSGVTFRLDSREKVALVGRNGTGKTTLLKIITGQYAPDTGSINIAQGAKIGYLKQEAPVTMGRTVIEEAESAVEQKLQLRERLEVLQNILDEGRATVDDLEEFSLIHEHFMEAEGYSAEHDLRVVLQKMGFTEEEFTKQTDKLSGGEKTRLAIARLLLEEPDLLILDEPTNHLDLQATEWLEGWLKSYHGAVLLVSHDRAFLANAADRVLEMRDGTVKSYPGPFEKFLELRAEEDARQTEVARRQQNEIDKMDEYVRRFMNSQRTAQARGRLKQMTKLQAVQVQAPKNEKGMKAGFGAVKRSGDLVLVTEKLAVGFPGNCLIRHLDWTVRLGERWGVIGENGSGKSTLARTFLNVLPALAGQSKVGANVVVGYFTQDAQDLDPESSPLDILVWDYDLLPADARNLLGKFLLSGDDVYRPVKTLSGGEKNKLSLAILTHLNPNLLVLDEPTNHLDMASRDALAEVLRNYKGTLILISHDRWLLEQVTDHTLDIRHTGPVLYNGTYAEYRRKLASGIPAYELQKVERVEASADSGLSPRELSKEIGRIERVIKDTEKEISNLELEIKDLENRLEKVKPTDDVWDLSKSYAASKDELEGSVSAWTEHMQRLEELRALQGA